MAVLAGLVLASIVDGRPLLDTVVVALPFDLCIWWEGQNALHRLPGVQLALIHTHVALDSTLPNLEDPSAIIGSPDTQDILPVAHAEDNPTDVLAGLCELIPYEREEQVLPVAV